MTLPKKSVPDVTIYIEEYAAFCAHPGRPNFAGITKWNALWEKLSVSQRAKLTKRAQQLNVESPT